MLNPRKHNGKKGFSLVELIIVIAIIAILAVAIIPNAGTWIESARKSTAKSTCTTVAQNLMTEIATAGSFDNLLTSKSAADLSLVAAISLDTLDATDYTANTLVYDAINTMDNGQSIAFYKGSDFIICTFFAKGDASKYVYCIYDSSASVANFQATDATVAIAAA